MIIQSTGPAAQANPTQHRLRPGKGYFHQGGEPKIPPGVKALPPVLPPTGALPDSRHSLNNAGGGKTILTWTGMHWRHPHSPAVGNRLAWTPEHMGKAGWSYDKAV